MAGELELEIVPGKSRPAWVSASSEPPAASGGDAYQAALLAAEDAFEAFEKRDAAAFVAAIRRICGEDD